MRSLLLLVFIGAAVPSNLQAELANPQQSFEQRVLFAHNRERLAQQVPPLRWSADLEGSARQWAEHLARTGKFEHAPEDRADPEGENLWAGTRASYRPEEMVGAWIREKQFYQPGAFPNNSSTGQASDVGHYTQVVWRDTREVGCAKATNASEDILVCRYAQAGNYVGQRPF